MRIETNQTVFLTDRDVRALVLAEVNRKLGSTYDHEHVEIEFYMNPCDTARMVEVSIPSDGVDLGPAGAPR